MGRCCKRIALDADTAPFSYPTVESTTAWLGHFRRLLVRHENLLTTCRRSPHGNVFETHSFTCSEMWLAM